MIERISGSGEFKADYERLQQAEKPLKDTTIYQFQKKKGSPL